MGGKIPKRLIAILLAATASLSLSAQTSQRDSLVRLMKATSVQLIEKFGAKYRKAVDATFLHNGTYLICDTALWNVDAKVINSEGHVKIVQDATVLTSDKLDYYIDRDLAQFRGSVVQLTDKDHNTLRTRNLDYNTRDSVATFRHGGSMRDKDGQIIESDDGTYDSKSSEFTFTRNVNMFTDSVFVKTENLLYEGGNGKAWFKSDIDFWKDGNMLSSRNGWYDRQNEIFFFSGAVHALSENQESWSDTLYFYRTPGDVLLEGHAQVQDTTRNVNAVADHIYYCDTLSRVMLWGDAAVALVTSEQERTDTIYFGADTLIYETVRMCDISEEEIKASAERLDDMNTDPVTEYRRKAAQEAAAAAEEAAKNNPNLGPRGPRKGDDGASGEDSGESGSDQDGDDTDKAETDGDLSGGDADSGSVRTPSSSHRDTTVTVPPLTRPRVDTLPGVSSPPDSLTVAPDSLSVMPDSLGTAPDVLPPPDSLAAPDDNAFVPDSLAAPLDSAALALRDSLAVADSLAALPPPDTTKVGFMYGIGNVKIFREDIQVKCDSMRYCDLDSIARFYVDPVVWNDGNRQYSSDSLFVLVRNGGADRASLLSNAFIITQEDSLCYDQIKGTEVMAYFDSTAALKRFDALGGATALFYLQENDAFATVNKVDSKMLSAMFVDGQIDRVYYFDQPHNDAYPVVQLPPEERKMKGFNWQPELRPSGKADITSLDVKASERSRYEARPKASFRQTDIYFPGYISDVYRQIAVRDSLKRLPPPPKPVLRDSLDLAPADSLAAAPADSVLAASAADSLALRDTTVMAVKDSLAIAADSLSTAVSPADSVAAAETPLSEKELKAKKRAEAAAEREARAKARVEKREKRWAELDARDAAKAEEKAARELEKKRQATLRALEIRDRNEERDKEKLERYKARFEKKKARQDARRKPERPSRKKAAEPLPEQIPEQVPEQIPEPEIQ